MLLYLKQVRIENEYGTRTRRMNTTLFVYQGSFLIGPNSDMEDSYFLNILLLMNELRMENEYASNMRRCGILFSHIYIKLTQLFFWGGETHHKFLVMLVRNNTKTDFYLIYWNGDINNVVLFWIILIPNFDKLFVSKEDCLLLLTSKLLNDLFTMNKYAHCHLYFTLFLCKLCLCIFRKISLGEFSFFSPNQMKKFLCMPLLTMY